MCAALVLACAWLPGCSGSSPLPEPAVDSAAVESDAGRRSPLDTTAGHDTTAGQDLGGEPTVDDALAVLEGYYAALATRRYGDAYAAWGDEGRRSGLAYARFRAGFDSTASVRARVGTPGPVEGAAGSRFVEIPVTIEARSLAGRVRRYAGRYVLRRVVVDGATESQRRWHLESARIRALPDTASVP